jgi:FkbM family methyltransferase
MRAASIWGKLIQLSNLPWPQWSQFIQGWLRRKRLGTVPCVLPGSTLLLQIPLRDFYETYWFFSESKRGIDELAFFLNRLRSGDIIYDIGAFRGAYGAAAKAALGDAVAVHLFEPVQENLQRIEAISRLNGFQRFEIVGKAVGLGTTVKGMFDEKDLMLREGDVSNALLPMEMPATSVDAYAEHTRAAPSVIKLDVEGFELEVLEGGRKCLAEHKPRLWVEVHPNFLAAQGRHWKDVIEILKSLGYRTMNFYSDYKLPTRDLAFHLWCEN